MMGWWRTFRGLFKQRPHRGLDRIQVLRGVLADGRSEFSRHTMPIPPNSATDTVRGPRRTQLVLGSFCLAMTGAFALLALDAPTPVRGFPLVYIPPLPEHPSGNDPIFATENPIERQRWDGIVIHHLGDPFGTPESIHRQHLSWGYQGLGYHFIIGNGNGLADGEVHVGYRWTGQLPGAHVVGDAGREHNERSIGICLIGNGDIRAFSDLQIRHLSRLVQRLQCELQIPRDHVRLHRKVALGVNSPGRLFPVAEFESQLLDLPR